MSKHPCYDTCFSTKTAYKVCSFRLMYFYTFRIFVILYYHQYIHVEGVLHWNNNSLCSFSLHFLLLLDVKFGCTRNKSSHAYLSICLSVTDLNTSLRGLALFRFLFFFFFFFFEEPQAWTFLHFNWSFQYVFQRILFSRFLKFSFVVHISKTFWRLWFLDCVL